MTDITDEASANIDDEGSSVIKDEASESLIIKRPCRVMLLGVG